MVVDLVADKFALLFDLVNNGGYSLCIMCVLIQLNGEMGKKFYLATSQSVAEIKLSIVDAVVKKCVNSLIYAVRGRQ